MRLATMWGMTETATVDAPADPADLDEPSSPSAPDTSEPEPTGERPEPEPAPDRTPAEAHAEVLIAVARVLASHPDLVPVEVSPAVEGVTSAHLVDCRPHVATALAEWAAAMDADPAPVVTAQAAYVRSLDAVVHVTGTVAAHPVQVWSHVPSLSTTVGLPHPEDQWHTVTTTVEVLRAFDAGDTMTWFAPATELVPPEQR